MARYVALIYSTVESGWPSDPAVGAAVMEDYFAFGDRAEASGVLAGGDALEPPAAARTVRVVGGKGGEVLTTDGPFAETKEVLGGFYLLDCANLDEALTWASAIPGAWDGCVEVRPVIDFESQ